MADERKTNGAAERDRGIVDTMLELGEATTLFTLDQMQTAVTMLVNPSRALDHMKDSMAILSKALKKSTSGRRSENGEGDSDIYSGSGTHVRTGTVNMHDLSTSGRQL